MGDAGQQPITKSETCSPEARSVLKGLRIDGTRASRVPSLPCSVPDPQVRKRPGALAVYPPDPSPAAYRNSQLHCHLQACLCHDGATLIRELRIPPSAYDHRCWRIRDPVRSPIDKPATARLVVGSLTTSESLVLCVFFAFASFFLHLSFHLLPLSAPRVCLHL